MDTERTDIDKFIAKVARKNIREAKDLELSIQQQVGEPTPTNDLPNLKKDRIVLQLTNRTNQDQSINLFALPEGINPQQDLQYGELFETVYSEALIEGSAVALLQSWDINWIDEDGNPQTASTPAVTGITALISALKTATNDNWDYYAVAGDFMIFKIPIDTWVYWNPPPPPFTATPPANSKPASFYTANTFTTITTATDTYTFTSYNVVGGTGVSVVETTGNFSYTSLVAELRDNVEPYFFNTMSVYADNIDQANTPIAKVKRGVSGTKSRATNYPAIFSQSQFVVTEEISLPMRALYELQYTVNAFNTVTLIFTYTKGNLNAIAEVINAYIEDGIPFNASLKQLEVEVSKKEKEYLEETLKSVWKRKQRELAEDGVQIEIDNIFEPQDVIDEKKSRILGEKMALIKKHIEERNYNKLRDPNVSDRNIKNLVANYAAKNGSDEINDPYNYMGG